MIIRLLHLLYARFLQIYPRAFRLQFGDEMQIVFHAMLADARRQGFLAVIALLWRELLQAPGAILRARHAALLNSARQSGRSPWGLLFLPPIDFQPTGYDGRYSRFQAALEMVPFFFGGALLLALTYAGFSRSQTDQLGVFGLAAFLVALPASLLGLARGLPRWTYPWLGFLAGFSAFVAYRHNMIWFLVAILFSAFLLLFAAAVAHLRMQPLPARLQWLGRSLCLDWTQLSFALLGAFPFTILIAFDDGYVNDRTLYLATSVLVMVLGALLYSRSRHGAVQITTLLLAVTLSLVSALLKQAYFRGGLLSWLSSPASWTGNVGWLLQLWGTMMVLLVAPQYVGPAAEKLVRSVARTSALSRWQ